jgi:ribosomal-protein-alanine N-acetyltransferase
MRYLVERMHLNDIPQVQIIETQSFSAPWSAQAYEQDLRTNKLAHYIVLREINDETPSTSIDPAPAPPSSTPMNLLQRLRSRLGGRRMQVAASPKPPIIGFAGIWMMVDEAHLVTIAIAPGQRGKGLGELLLVSATDLACILGASKMTLEVRVSNHVAQSLYRKYGYKNEGVRRRYYSDNGEDALIMTTDALTSAYYQAHYQELKHALLSRVKATLNLM